MLVGVHETGGNHKTRTESVRREESVSVMARCVPRCALALLPSARFLCVCCLTTSCASRLLLIWLEEAADELLRRQYR